MNKKITRKLFALSASVLTLFAMATAVSACAWFTYQPEEPKLLRDK